MFIIVIVPGGSISQDGEKPRTSYCIFDAPEDMESMRNHEQVCYILFRTHIENLVHPCILLEPVIIRLSR